MSSRDLLSFFFFFIRDEIQSLFGINISKLLISILKL